MPLLEFAINSLTHTEIYEITITQPLPDPVLLKLEGKNEEHEIRKVNAINLERLLKILNNNQIDINQEKSTKKIRYFLNEKITETPLPLLTDFTNVTNRIILEYSLQGHLQEAQQNRLEITLTDRNVGYGIVWKLQYISYSNPESSTELNKALSQFKKTLKDFYN